MARGRGPLERRVSRGPDPREGGIDHHQGRGIRSTPDSIASTRVRRKPILMTRLTIQVQLQPDELGRAKRAYNSPAVNCNLLLCRGASRATARVGRQTGKRTVLDH